MEGTVSGISDGERNFETNVSRIEAGAGPADHDLNWMAK